MTRETGLGITGADLIDARWRVSARTNGSSTCVQAAILDATTPWRISARTQGSSTCVQAALVSSDAHWRQSTRSQGANTCIEETTDGTVVALQNSTAPYPDGPVLTVSANVWPTFLDHVAAGHLDHAKLGTPRPFGPFTVGVSGGGAIEVRCAEHPGCSVVRYTPKEWDVFLAGVKVDGEFTLEWLLDKSPTHS